MNYNYESYLTSSIPACPIIVSHKVPDFTSVHSFVIKFNSGNVVTVEGTWSSGVVLGFVIGHGCVWSITCQVRVHLHTLYIHKVNK